MVAYLQLIPNSEEHWEYIRLLRNDRRVRHGFIQQVDVSVEQQREYMQKYSTNYWIALCNGFPAGYIGVIDGDIRIAVHPDYQNKKIGSFMVKELAKKIDNLQAKVRIDNPQSLAMFISCGFNIKYFILEPKNDT